MKTHQPKDFSKTPEDYLRESRMGESDQKLYLQTSISWIVVVVACLVVAGMCISELWDIYKGVTP